MSNSKYNTEERRLADRLTRYRVKAERTEIYLCGLRHKILELQKKLRGKYEPRF